MGTLKLNAGEFILHPLHRQYQPNSLDNPF
jgi:hypothetical protein